MSTTNSSVDALQRELLKGGKKGKKQPTKKAQFTPTSRLIKKFEKQLKG